MHNFHSFSQKQGKTKCAAFGQSFPTNCLWVVLNMMHLVTSGMVCVTALAADLPGVFLRSGNSRTLHPREDSPPVGQNKVPGSLWADLGSVYVPAQVNPLVIKNNSRTFLHPSLFLTNFLAFFFPLKMQCKPIYLLLSPPELNLSCAFFSRNKIALDSTQALFLLVAEKSMSCMSSSMGEVYSHYRDTDGFLYITYASQEMFGAPLPAAGPPCWAKRADIMNWTSDTWWWHRAAKLGKAGTNWVRPRILLPRSCSLTLHMILPHDPFFTPHMSCSTSSDRWMRCFF